MTSNTRPDNFPVRHYRPDVAFPIELVQEGWHFSSGVNTAGDVRGLALSGSHVGICAETVNDALIAELENYGGCGSLQWLFVDTGAFSEVAFGPTGITVVKPICDADWMRIFALHQWAAQTYGRRALCVAPDQVGNQLVTLERLERYAAQVAAVAALGANIIVPVQKGALPMSEMFDLVRRTLPDLVELFDSIRPSLLTQMEPAALLRIYSDMSPSNFSVDVLAARPNDLAVLSGGNLGWSDLGETSRVLSILERSGSSKWALACLEECSTPG